jgi:hypothetical protein
VRRCKHRQSGAVKGVDNGDGRRSASGSALKTRTSPQPRMNSSAFDPSTDCEPLLTRKAPLDNDRNNCVTFCAVT